jgi:ribosomal protein S20
MLNVEDKMNNVKEEVQTLLKKLPDNCTFEDVQYHLYVIEKIQRGIERAEKEGTASQEEVERRLSKWTSK